jgi:hypothetical protein
MMKPLKITAIAALATLLGVTSIEIGPSTSPVTLGLVTSALAIVGRPLTPVSYAGVARRTVRRCRAGVYNC